MSRCAACADDRVVSHVPRVSGENASQHVSRGHSPATGMTTGVPYGIPPPRSVRIALWPAGGPGAKRSATVKIHFPSESLVNGAFICLSGLSGPKGREWPPLGSRQRRAGGSSNIKLLRAHNIVHVLLIQRKLG